VQQTELLRAIKIAAQFIDDNLRTKRDN